ncbi:hypothetical protein B0H21DRAFT_159882 [Amylocystis lapponica]|nr:hypothetical protein B0H21DRAFT_159882 [Amylocystis lapponica]
MLIARGLLCFLDIIIHILGFLAVLAIWASCLGHSRCCWNISEANQEENIALTGLEHCVFYLTDREQPLPGWFLTVLFHITSAFCEQLRFQGHFNMHRLGSYIIELPLFKGASPFRQIYLTVILCSFRSCDALSSPLEL